MLRSTVVRFEKGARGTRSAWDGVKVIAIVIGKGLFGEVWNLPYFVFVSHKPPYPHVVVYISGYFRRDT